MKKIVTVLGARPQFVKAAVLSRVIKKHSKIEEVIIHTGQHFDKNMSAVFFDEMQIPKPKYNLAINGLTHGAMTGQMLEKVEQILMKESPDAVVVYGDTNSTLAGALAAKKLHIKLVHIEAGLRSFNHKMPEEINRILTDRISDLLSCPTDTAIANLEKEGTNTSFSTIVKHGDIMKDAVAYYGEFSSEKSSVIKDLELENSDFILASIHRQENTDNIDSLKNIFAALEEIHQKQKVVLPLHPRTSKVLKQNNLNTNITIVPPLGYFDMLELLKKCALVVTDSGGLQKEAFFNKKGCVVVREETEWVELVEHNFAILSGSSKTKIKTSVDLLLNEELDFSKNLFGDNVGEKIYQSIRQLIES